MAGNVGVHTHEQRRDECQTVEVAAAGDSTTAGSAWSGLLLILVSGLLLSGMGFAMARDFRGVTEWHVRKTFQIMRPVEVPLRRVPPWKQMLKKPLEERIRRQVKLERAIGVAFAAAGGLMIVGGVVAFLAWRL